ncbi:hypothetical protein THAOC_12422 [Thalassiosira oceanica]|uniref:Uncharacterized protein n=1 Tax=Thalassiosira oceanica TaxID=159749 RepID=K0SMP7_THAOC|nr:hypothetical protein THAOC_12422 [Thalassiosira oceanica]|eukprot:EJK66645.1 hypothetical protein THAOC_12422 [Thalassiosira oceanica]
MIANTAIRAAARVGSRRPMSTVAAPKMHKAKDAWSELQKTRPPPGHPHLVFEGDYSTPFIGAAVIGVVASGYGMMYFGMRHQQYKQGYWK